MTDFNNNLFKNVRETEKLEELSGERGQAKKKGAIRLDDFRELLMLPPKLQSTQLASNPTANDFNKLQTDLNNIHQVLYSLSTTIQKRLI